MRRFTILFFVFAFTIALQAQNTGAKLPGTVASFGAGNNWINPSNASGSDNQYASSYLPFSGGNVSAQLRATNFGFAVPTNATITGIVVTIEKNGTTNIQGVFDNWVSLLIGGSTSGSNKANGNEWPTTDAVVNYGGASDLWGATLTPAIVNTSTFGVTLVAYNADQDNDNIAAVDNITMTIYYTIPIVPGVAITSDGSTPAASAILELKTTSQGFLLPRMSTTQRNAISSPATGLMIYDNTLGKPCFYNGSAWQTFTTTAGLNPGGGGNGSNSDSYQNLIEIINNQNLKIEELSGKIERLEKEAIKKD
jgi:hypothetical protein